MEAKKLLTLALTGLLAGGCLMVPALAEDADGQSSGNPATYTIPARVKRIEVTITFSTVYREAKCAGVKMIPLEDELHSVISLFYRKNKPLDYAKKQFLNYVREHLYM